MIRALLFDFGGTLDYPRHWLDRFLRHYHEAGFQLTRDELDGAFDAATRTAYRSGSLLRRERLAELLDYLIDLQLAFLRDHHVIANTNLNLADDSARNRAREQIGCAFVAESRAGMAASRQFWPDWPPISDSEWFPTFTATSK